MLSREEERKLQQQREHVAALELAGKIFQIVAEPEFLLRSKEVDRYQFLSAKYRQFNQAYPMVLKYMALYQRYQEKAFRRLLRLQTHHPGKGMQGFIDCQIKYLDFLYEEECYQKNRHPDHRLIESDKSAEYKNLQKWYRSVKEQEKKSRNEFAEEKKNNLRECREELLDFVNREAPAPPATDLDLAQVDPQTLEPDVLVAAFLELRTYNLHLQRELAEQSAERQLQIKKITALEKQLQDSEWLPRRRR